jgi:hypothetical protein
MPNAPRGLEIQWWLEQNNFQHVYFDFMIKYRLACQIESYVIIDDDSDMLYKQRDNFVRTNTLHGFTENDMHKAIKILNTPIITTIE